MKLDVNVDIQALEDLAQNAERLIDGANRAVQRQTEETLGEMRSHTAQRLGARTANALGRRFYVNEDRTVAGFIHSRWWRRGAGGGPRQDILEAFSKGEVITPKRGQFLAIPLPAAYAVAGASRGGQRPTPERVETALDQDLFVIQRAGRPPILCAKNVAISTRRRGTIRAGRFRSKGGILKQRRTVNAIVPLFVLVKNVRLPKRLDFPPITEKADERLAEKLIVELVTRGVID
jgi:hypothetical protein